MSSCNCQNKDNRSLDNDRGRPQISNARAYYLTYILRDDVQKQTSFTVGSRVSSFAVASMRVNTIHTSAMPRTCHVDTIIDICRIFDKCHQTSRTYYYKYIMLLLFHFHSKHNGNVCSLLALVNCKWTLAILLT